jgi:hypothetical protein
LEFALSPSVMPTAGAGRIEIGRRSEPADVHAPARALFDLEVASTITG